MLVTVEVILRFGLRPELPRIYMAVSETNSQEFFIIIDFDPTSCPGMLPLMVA